MKDIIYCGYVNNEAVAFHKKKKPVSIYLQNYKVTNPQDSVKMIILDKSFAMNMKHYNDYYLVKCHETYIQSKYRHILEIDVDYYGKLELIRQIKKVIKETNKKSEKDALMKALKIVKVNKNRCGTYTPSLKVLSERYWDYEEYKNRIC